MKNKLLFAGFLIIIVVLSIIYIMNYTSGKEKKHSDEATDRISEYSGAVLKTNLGDVELEFFNENAPLAVINFTELANIGFYNGTKFHRVIEGFMIQGGDPLSKDDEQKSAWGTGGPGYSFKDEIYSGNSNIAGSIAMANAGPDTNGSQFFINVADNNFLDTKHTVFGRVVSGMDIVTAISSVETDDMDRPVENVVVLEVVLR